MIECHASCRKEGSSSSSSSGSKEWVAMAAVVASAWPLSPPAPGPAAAPAPARAQPYGPHNTAPTQRREDVREDELCPVRLAHMRVEPQQLVAIDP